MTRAADILKLTKQLFPTGRAFRVPKNGVLEKLLLGLAESEARLDQFALNTLNRIIPDNNSFTEEDATQWERRLALRVNTVTSLESRKKLILRKYQFPGNIRARQNYRYMEDQLQLAGFEVTVTENLSGGSVGAYSEFVHDFEAEHGFDTEMGSSSLDIIANSIKKGEVFTLNDARGCFYISGNVQPDLIESFRQLVLALKPANTVAVLNLTYEYPANLAYMSGPFVESMSNVLIRLTNG